MFCSHCGKEIPDGSTVCSECGAQLVSVQQSSAEKIKKEMKKDPLLVVGLIFSLIAFITGFVIVTTALALNRGIGYVEYITMIPAFIGLAAGIFKSISIEKNKETSSLKVMSAACIILSLFTLLYAFVGFMVFIV